MGEAGGAKSEGEETADDASPSAEAKPHYLGHRQRLRERLLAGGAETLADYELLEFLLFGAKPRGEGWHLGQK